jgi:hypothetical protein
MGRLAGFRYRANALLIFDEVITGFRLCYGGAQSVYKIEPDLTTLGKIIGGGLPVAAYGGRVEIMNHVAPLGAVYQAGTLSGNPLAMRCASMVVCVSAMSDAKNMADVRMSSLWCFTKTIGCGLADTGEYAHKRANASTSANKGRSIPQCFLEETWHPASASSLPRRIARKRLRMRCEASKRKPFSPAK